MEKSIVVVTGAAMGIGRAIAMRAARENCVVIAADINEADATVAAILAAGGHAEAYQCDVRSADSIDELFDWVEDTHGAVDILINNAGTMGRWPLSLPDISETDWYTVFDTNVKSVFLCCRRVLPMMRKRGAGAIVNIASELAFVVAEGCAVYCASKAAILQLTKAIAVDEAKHGIRVNCVCPGPVDTQMLLPSVESEELSPESAVAESASLTSVGRVGRPEEIANVVWFAASPEASYMVGSALLVDGGVTLT
jgi:NAD(P)-dependent dehydrogenase (short-subunit alcohol dehydrogenase family)